MPRLFTAFFISSLMLSAAAMAEPDPIEQRQDLMKQAGKAAKAIGNMLKEKEPFDDTVALESLMAWQNTANKVELLFPPGSDSGHDTEASPNIWTNKEEFDKKLTDFQWAAKEAAAAYPSTLAELGDAASPVFKTCKACHEDFRVEKDD